MAASTRKKKPSKKKSSVVRELGAIHEWMQSHEKSDDRRHEEGAKKMQYLATKDDLQTVMMDQASKDDVSKLSQLLFNEEGDPMFATKEDMQPILDLYRGSTFVKSFTAGTAAFVITLAAVGYAIITIIGWIRGTH